MITLKESILQDMDITLSTTDNDAKVVVNGTVPKAKDFHYISMIWTGVEWGVSVADEKICKGC